MCKIGFIRFGEKTKVELRKKMITRLLVNSWNMGNPDGAGLYLFNDPLTQEFLIKAIDLSDVLRQMNDLADIPNNVVLHTRLATNAVNYENTQPLSTPNLVLAHNGIVHSFEKYQLTLETTNDSEIILKLYEKYGNVKETNERLGGSFNYILVDKLKKKLIINSSIKEGFGYYQNNKFYMKAQNGNTFIYQSEKQLRGISIKGLNNLIGYDELPHDKYMELPISKKMFADYEKLDYFSYKYDSEEDIKYWDTKNPKEEKAGFFSVMYELVKHKLIRKEEQQVEEKKVE